MSLHQELKNLKKQQRQELNNLHFTYLRTKREIKRAASPDRFIRRHLGATMGVAAILGLLLAPRPAPRVQEKPERKPGDSILGHLAMMLKKVLGLAEQAIPSPKQTEAAKAEQKKREKAALGGGFLQAILGVLLSKVDISRILTELSRSLMSKMQGKDSTHNGHAPHVAVADVGTVKPDDYENFE